MRNNSIQGTKLQLHIKKKHTLMTKSIVENEQYSSYKIKYQETTWYIAL